MVDQAEAPPMAAPADVASTADAGSTQHQDKAGTGQDSSSELELPTATAAESKAAPPASTQAPAVPTPPDLVNSSRVGSLGTLQDDGLTVKFMEGGDGAKGAAQACRGSSVGNLYFELTVVEAQAGFSVFVGLAPAACDLDAACGLTPSSFGYSSVDGGVYTGSDAPVEMCALFAAGDVVGAGVRVDEKEVFFTLNGEVVSTSSGVELNEELFPTLGGSAVTLVANFGQKAFAFPKKPAPDLAAGEDVVLSAETKGLLPGADTTHLSDLQIKTSSAMASELLSKMDTGFYDREVLRPIPSEDELNADLCTLVHSFGMDCSRRNNLYYVGPGILLFGVGNVVQLLDLETMQQSYLPGLDGGGVGAVTVHPSRKYFVVGEKGKNPKVYVYEYPSLNLYKILRNGTEKGYGALRFNKKGTKLATVGMYPDYFLTVWNWEEEAILLRAKAFSQDVFDVSFSEYFDGQLLTSGQGHIRFWKMASTFTGLKLQGDIGKFGNEEISDVCGYAEFPDGKVLSGTESGKMLLWDGGLIKLVVVRPGARPCHDGNIERVTLDMPSKTIITSGADGFIKAWDYEKLNDAEAGEDSNVFEMLPSAEHLVGKGVKIKSLVYEEDHYIVQDEAGSLLRVQLPSYQAKRIMACHAGAICGLVTSKHSHFAITAGADGTVRLWDYVATRLLYTRRFMAGASALVAVPDQLDPKHRQVAIGFEDGVLRLVLRCADEWKLVQALKPHKGAVSCLAYSPDSAVLASLARDQTIFFFNLVKVKGACTPICFVTIPGVPTAVSWSSDSTRLLIGCQDGQIFEMARPPAEVDTTKTFEIKFDGKFYEFRKPKPKKEPKEKEEEEENEEGENEAQEEEIQEEEEEEEEEEQVGGFEVKTISYVEERPEQFVVTMGGKAAGMLYQCAWDEPEVLGFSPTVDAPVGVLAQSHSGRFVLTGADNGVVRLQPQKPIGLDGTGPSGRPKYWEQPVHDAQHGGVTGVALSFDDHYLLSTGRDGSFFVQQISLPEGYTDGELDGDMTAVPKAVLEPIEEVHDILTAEAYSIEEAKQKTEEDNLLQAAEEKKMAMRQYIQTIRDEFLELLQANERRPEEERLPREEFEIDPDLRKMIEEQTEEKIREAKLEMQWESEKKSVALRKLNAFFLDNVEVERIVLRPFRERFQVTSFRTAKLPPAMKEEIAKVHQAVADEEQKQMEAAADKGVDRGGGAGAGGHVKFGDSKAQDPQGKGKKAETSHEEAGLSKADLRRLQRKKREEEWAEFNKTKPDENYENPDDVAAIQEAIKNMGDFKLKTDPNYIVPEEQRQNAVKKRRQIVLLEESVYNIKMDFNTRFLALREVKKQMMKDIERSNGRISEINTELHIEEPLFLPVTQDDEFPERRNEVTDEDLEAYKLVLQQREAAAKDGNKGGFQGGGSKGEKEGKPDKAAVEKAQDKAKAAAPFKGGKAGVADGAAADKPVVEDSRIAALKAIPPTPLEEMEKKILHKQMEFERLKLVKRQDEAVRTFDEALADLRREKFRLEADVKSAEMKRLVLFQEFLLLKESEKQDQALKARLDAKMAERTDILAKIAECQEKLEMKKDEVERLMEKKKLIVGEFDGMVEESNAFREPLLKIFNRKIKRVKKKVKDNDDEDYDSEEEEEEDDDEDFDDEEEEEVCPLGCDQALYEKVCDLREKRLDQEDVIIEFQKSMETFKKEKDNLAKKQKTIESALKKIDEEIAGFQKDKQDKLNDIDVVITLKMHQMEYLIDDKLPSDYSLALVFSNQALRRLKSRIKELVQEKAQLKRKQKELRREHIQLLRDRKAKEQRIAELEARAYDVQMLKFGMLIDLDVLDRMGSNKNVEDLKESLRQQERAHAAELAEWTRKIEEARAQLTEATKQNTACLAAVADLTNTQKQLEGVLNNTQGGLFQDPMAQRRKEIEERDHLVHVVNKQAREIEAIKKEISLLRVKGGQVYG